jgi:DNA-binding response OmpR family regulator
VWFVKILVVEDEIRISNLLRLYLEREAYQVDMADNGKDGLEFALKEDYSLIVLDVLMPVKNGYEILQEVRRIKKTPVIMLSAKCSEEDIKRAKDFGANDFIAKPFSPSMVVSKIKEILLQEM